MVTVEQIIKKAKMAWTWTKYQRMDQDIGYLGGGGGGGGEGPGVM